MESKYPLLNIFCKYRVLSVLFVGLLLRTLALGSFPPHLRNDEASIAYNAYSILETGRDDSGRLLPINFISFGDWKPGLMIYLTAPFIKIFGLNEFSIRFFTSIAGVLGIYFFYKLMFLLFKNKTLAFLSLILISISPWHITFSRGVWEAQICLTANIFAIYIFLFGIQKKKEHFKYFILSEFMFLLSLYISHSSKIIVPLFVFSLLIVYGKDFLRLVTKKQLFFVVVIFIAFVFPMLWTFIGGQNDRIISLFYRGNPLSLINRWFENYSFPILFFMGDGNPQHTAYKFGAFYFFEVFLLIIGLYSLRSYFKKSLKPLLILILWVIIAPLPSILSNTSVNFVRTLPLLLIIQMVISLGLYRVILLQRSWFVKIFIAVFYAGSFILFLDRYFVHNATQNKAWQYGYKQLVEALEPIQQKYKQVYIPQSTDQPYIYFLLYKKFPPTDFFEIHKRNYKENCIEGYGCLTNLENITFYKNSDLNFEIASLIVINYELKKDNENMLTNMRLMGTINDVVGFPVFYLYEN